MSLGKTKENKLYNRKLTDDQQRYGVTVREQLNIL